jgi:hypothetical protein
MENIMNNNYTFIHELERKKKELEPQPMYIEVGPPPQKENQQNTEEESKVLIIEIF